MRRHGIEQRIWIGIYLALILLPVALLAFAPEAGTADKQFAIALGLAAFVGMTLQVVLAARVPQMVQSAGMDTLLRLHRYMGSVLMILVITHVVIFMLQRGVSMFEWIFFIDRTAQAWSGAIAWWAMILLTVTSIWRTRIRLSYEQWRVAHLLLTAAVLFAAYLHMLTGGDYVNWVPLRIVITIGLLGAVAAFAYLRVGRAFRASVRPYLVDSVREEQGSAVTLRLVAADHSGVIFAPGDIAWLRFSGAPYSLTEHPFSVSSSTHDPRMIEFTCKLVGDHTRMIASLSAGTKVYVDGPHGKERPRLDAQGHVLISAGIGITPIMSLLRTLAHDPLRARVPITLIHGATKLNEVTFGEELSQLKDRLVNLDIVLALSHPSAGWEGHVGRIDSSLIERVSKDQMLSGWDVFVCGPAELLSTVEHTCARLGVPASRLHVERFEGV